MQLANAFIGCLVLMADIASSSAADAKGNNLRIHSHAIIGCGALQKEVCSPAVECNWCDNIHNNSAGGSGSGSNGGRGEGQNVGGTCMEFDAWIGSCLDSKIIA
mmetsp:Transcript_11035/g.27127  ORF Transcript_11035/g.27127 Transcript_11035/m.27127 type:complete len:104 (+) Transcript_11035:97-408(+)